LIADFYRRFLRRDASERHYVHASRVATVLLVVAAAYVSAQLATVGQGWQVVLEVGAGTGGVYLLRWYWWRVNAWSEISAMAAALASTLALHWRNPFVGSVPLVFAKTALATTAITTVVWVAVTFLTPAEPLDILTRFYRHVRPDATGWRAIAALAPDVAPTRDLGRNLFDWLLGCVMVYAALFAGGKFCFEEYRAGFACAAVAAISAALLYRDVTRRFQSDAIEATHA
jgi:hypothetical protein